jgi:hypothetical protein
METMVPSEGTSTTSRYPDPEIPLNPDGPWLSFWTEDSDSCSHLFIMNPDGTGKSEVKWCQYCSQPAISDSSPYIAYVRTNLGDVIRSVITPIAELVIIEVPTLEELHVIDLLSNSSLEDIDDLFESDQFEIARLSSPSWSPDGTKVAFVAAIDAPNIDLYVFDIQQGRKMRLSSGPNHASAPFWSPDGQFVIHREVAQYSLGDNCDELGVWSAPIEEGEIKWLFRPKGCTELRGWVGDSFLITFDYRMVQPLQELVDIRLTDRETGLSKVICEGNCNPNLIVIDPVHEFFVFQKDFINWSLINPATGGDQMLQGVEGMEAPVWNKGVERLIFKARCMGRSGHFSIEPNGSIGCTVDTYERKFPSPDMQWSISDLGILYAGGELVRDLLEDSWFEKESQDVVWDLFHVIWEPNSSGAFLYKSSKLFYLDIPDGAPILIDDTGYISYGAHWFGVAE